MDTVEQDQEIKRQPPSKETHLSPRKSQSAQPAKPPTPRLNATEMVPHSRRLPQQESIAKCQHAGIDTFKTITRCTAETLPATSYTISKPEDRRGNNHRKDIDARGRPPAGHFWNTEGCTRNDFGFERGFGYYSVRANCVPTASVE